MEILWNTATDGGGSGTGFDGIVQVFSDLPVDGTAAVGEVWLVRQSEGTWFFNRKQRGLYQRIDDTGVREADWQYLGEWQEEFSDANFQVYNASDETKVAKLDASTISTGITRTYILPNANGTLALVSDLAGYQPLDGDLTAIAALSGVGYARRTGASAWALDDNYLTLGDYNGADIHMTVDDAAEEVQFNIGVDSYGTYELVISGTDYTDFVSGPASLDGSYGGPVGFVDGKRIWISSGDGEFAVVRWQSYLGGYKWIVIKTDSPGDNPTPGDVLYYSASDTQLPWDATGWVRVQTFNTNPITVSTPIPPPTGYDAYFSRAIHAPEMFLISPLGVASGGTGIESYAQGDIIFASDLNVLSSLPKNTTATRYLSNTGTSNNPEWAQINLTNGVTGTLPVSRGGTNFTSYAEGDLLTGNGSGTLSKIASPGVPGQVLVSGLGQPTWTALDSFAPTGIFGTANEISASSSIGNVTLSLPSSLTFTGKTVTGGTFNSGAFNGTVGATTPSTVAATTLTTTGNATINNTGAAAILTLKRTDGGATVEIRSRGDQMHIGTADNFPLNYYVNGAHIATMSSTGLNSTAIGVTNASTGAFTTVTASGGVTVGTTALLSSSVALSSTPGSSTGTLTNAPGSGNPTKWLRINDNGTPLYIPAWALP